MAFARTHLRSPVVKWIALLPITLLAAFYRFYLLDRLPPGDSWDPAYYGIDALQILRGARPIFFPSNLGREPLYSYLVALAFWVSQPGVFAIYVVSATIGVLSVPAVYFMANEMFAGEDNALLKRYGPALAALVTAISYWHLIWSRTGVRAVLLPLFTALVCAFLWRALRTGSWRAYAACGIVLGASVYTYQAARLLPVLVAAGFAFVAVREGRLRDRRLWLNFALVTALAIAVAAPLGLYAVTHPDEFNQRVSATFVLNESDEGGAAPATRLSTQIITTLSAFTFHGEEKWPRIGLSGRTILDPFLLTGLVLGIAVCLAGFKRPSYQFLLFSAAVMITPAFLAGEGPVAKRALGTLPAIMVLIALGLLQAGTAIVRRAPRLRLPLALVLIAGLAYTAVTGFRDYFVVWADWGNNPDLFTHFQVGFDTVGDYARALPAGELVYISPDLPEHPDIQFHSGLREGLRGYNGRLCLATPAQTSQPTTWIIAPSEDKNSLKLLARYFPQGTRDPFGPLHYGQPYVVAYRVPAGASAQITPAHPLASRWAGQIELLGYDLDDTAYAPGQSVHLVLYYRSLAPAAANYTVFVHLLGGHNPASGNTLWAGSDGEPCGRFYPTGMWLPGEIVRDSVDLLVPAEAPPGRYTLTIGLYTWPDGRRVQATDGAGQAAGDELPLGDITVAPAP